MEAGEATGGGGNTTGGPAPFLLKTYEMVDDSSTDEIVSWSSKKNSFVVWNPPEFARLLLPTYFKHNNFSSFIRQLNTYGFRKIDPERWEFANEDFVKYERHLLKNIRRRKPIHSHSQPQGSLMDAERAALEEEREKLSREKTVLQAKIWRLEEEKLDRKLQLEKLEQRVLDMEQRQSRMVTFLSKAVKNPSFVEHLLRMVGSTMDTLACNKKRRLPKTDYFQEVAESSVVDDHSSSSRPEFGHVFRGDCSDKLKLELSTAFSDNNLVMLSTQSSNDDRGSPQRNISEGDPNDKHMRFGHEILELSDTGTSFALKMDTNLLHQVRSDENPALNGFQLGLTSTEEGVGHVSCHLNLSLASSTIHINNSARISDLGYNANGIKADLKLVAKGQNANFSSSQEAPNNDQGPAAPQGRVNDVFWEQFLTERPGSSDAEEASSGFRANPYDEQDERKPRQGNSWKNIKIMEQLTL